MILTIYLIGSIISWYMLRNYDIDKEKSLIVKKKYICYNWGDFWFKIFFIIGWWITLYLFTYYAIKFRLKKFKKINPPKWL